MNVMRRNHAATKYKCRFKKNIVHGLGLLNIYKQVVAKQSEYFIFSKTIFMKKMIAFVLLACIGVTAVSAQKSNEKMLRHVVMFKFKDDATAANVKSVEDAFLL